MKIRVPKATFVAESYADIQLYNKIFVEEGTSIYLNIDFYSLGIDRESVLVESTELESNIPALLAEKEAELKKLQTEIEALKNGYSDSV